MSELANIQWLAAITSSIVAVAVWRIVTVAVVFVAAVIWLWVWARRYERRKLDQHEEWFSELFGGKEWKVRTEQEHRNQEFAGKCLRNSFGPATLAPIAIRENSHTKTWIFRYYQQSVQPDELAYRAIAVLRHRSWNLPSIFLLRKSMRIFDRIISPDWFAAEFPDIAQQWGLDVQTDDPAVRDLLRRLTPWIHQNKGLWQVESNGNFFACAGPVAEGAEVYRSVLTAAEDVKQRI